MQLQTGMVICATAGKEQHGFYVVTAVEGRFVLIADGKRRPLSHPKRKNIRHIAPTSTVWDIGEMTDKTLRCKLREYTAKGGY